MIETQHIENLEGGRLRIYSRPSENGYVELERKDLDWLAKFMDGVLNPATENAQRHNQRTPQKQ